VVFGLLGAFGAALCYGTASVLQALAARDADAVEGLDARLLLRLARSWRYVLGVLLDGLGFLLSLVAVRSLPLFLVQSIVASSLAITAILAAVVAGMKLSRWDKAAVTVVFAGLVLVGLSAAEDRSVDVSPDEEWGLLVAVLLLALAAVPMARLRGAAGAAALGAVAGLASGAAVIAARMLHGSFALDELKVTEEALTRNPASYALVLAGVVLMVAYPVALQRGTVTQATAPLVVGETVAPALVGILLLGDEPRPGWGWVAAAGFSLAVAGALSLSRHGEVSVEETGGAGPPRDSDVAAEMGKGI
jgi:drug/metabolite transporter (DMT)-like permease